MSRHPFRTLCWLSATTMLLLIVSCGGKKPPPPPPAPPPVQTPAPQVTPTPPPPPPRPTPTATPAPPPPAPPTQAELFQRMSLADLEKSKPLDDVFFEYDKADLSDSARASLQKDADWLRTNYRMNVQVLVEGHADSRGTNEYNLALGERRASAVKDYLVSLGIAASRVSVVSKGEEQPFCTEETDACWGQNRRGHFIITAK